MTPQQYLLITRAAIALREARMAAEMARQRLEYADACYAFAMREAGFDPTVEHAFHDGTLTIEPLAKDSTQQ